MSGRVTEEEAVAAFTRIFAEACHELDQQTPEEIAENAYVPGGPSKDEIANRVRRRRAALRAQRASKKPAA